MTTAVQTIDLTLLAPLLEKYNGRKREALLPLLHQAQDIYGWLPPEVQEAIGKTLRVPLADIHGVVEFYSMFYSQPTARPVIRVCEDLACSQAGSHAVIQAIEAELGLEPGETSEDGRLTFETVPCLGMCEHAPCALNGERPAGSLTINNVSAFSMGLIPNRWPGRAAVPSSSSSALAKLTQQAWPTTEAPAATKGCVRRWPRRPKRLLKRWTALAFWGAAGRCSPWGANGFSPVARQTIRAKSTSWSTPTRENPAPSKTAA